jgi:hypothetical protein
MASQASTATTTPTTPENRRSSTSSRPAGPNLIIPSDIPSEFDDEEPPPYSRYDPLTHPHLQDIPDEPLGTNRSVHGQTPVPVPQPPRHPVTPPSTHYGHSPPRHSMSTYPGQRSPRSPTRPVQHSSPYSTQQRPQNSPFVYPQGYMCPKCYNTGVKSYNGSPCGSCARLFGRQKADVHRAITS